MFPLWYLLIPYFIFVAIVGLFIFFNIYHIAKFGLESAMSNIVIAVYILSFLGILIFSAVVLLSFDWSDLVDFPTLLRFQLSPNSLDSL